ncbi:MAG: DUF4436 family protein [Acidimicrobiales bacterium]
MADIQHGATATDLADPALDDDGSSTLPGVHPWLIIGGVIVMVTVLATISSVLFNSTLRREPVTGTIGPSQVDDGVRVDGTVTNVDLTKNVMTLRITLDPTGSFDTNDSNIPSRPITMYYTGADGTKKVAFEAGKPIGATDLTLSLKEADDPIVPQVASPIQGSYPWDTYLAEVDLLFVTPSAGASAGGSGAGPTPAGASDAVVPANLVVYKTVPAFSVVEAKQKVTPEGVLAVSLEVSRAGTAKFFSLLVTVIMWALAVGVLLITVSVAKRRRKLETAQISMMAVILFAMPAALRSFQPGIPPPGVLSDFYGFFWADIVVALSLVTMLIIYLQRRTE